MYVDCARSGFSILVCIMYSLSICIAEVCIVMSEEFTRTKEALPRRRFQGVSGYCVPH